jgi:c(7)-type cytochrome triheme protein
VSRPALAQRKGLRAPALVGLVVLVMLVAVAGFALPGRLRIPKLAPHPPGTPAAAALFSHVRHAAMPCYMCHPSIFPQAPLGFTHAEMRQGRYCGACHDGLEASAIEKLACQECHVDEP